MFNQSFQLLKVAFCKRVLLKGLVAVCCALCFLYAAMEEACEVFYHGDANDLNDSTVVVPEESVALSSNIVVVPPDDEVIKIGSAPSIFFVIDHSGSMISNPGNDQMGQRFYLAVAIIDTLFNMFDSAEVGICVFRQHMFYDPVDDSRFVQAPGYDTGAYIPLLKLDSSYAPSGELGYQILQNYLETDTVNNAVELVYQPSTLNLERSTNINSGFAAAKHAMKSARYNRSRQFVIFLSDGEATYPRGSETQFLDDVKEDIPTTFTIYFTDQSTVPWQIDSLTKVIKANGYSTMNDSTKHFTIDLVQQDLMEFFEENILDVLIGQVFSIPLDMTVNGSTVSNFTNNSFTFDDLFPLMGVTTTFEYTINYNISKDSIVFDINGTPVETLTVQFDSTAKGEFDITVEDGVSLPTHYPDPFSLYCWQRGLEFYNGTTMLSYADETMNDLKIRFDFEEGDSTDYSYSTVKVDLSTTEGNAQDLEADLTLTESGGYWIEDFEQEIIADSDNPTPNDGKLQHYAFDSLVATFRNSENPKLPLDTVRHVIPFKLKGFIQSEAAYYYDRTADGYVDSIVVKITTDLDDGLTDEHLKEIMDSGLITLPAFRGFTIESYRLVQDGFALLVTENTGHEQVTYIRDDDSIKVSSKILSVGGWVEATTIPIYDKVGPIIMRRSKSFQGTGYLTPLLVDFQDTVADTLFIDFSEPVKNITDNVPFHFLNVDSNVEFTANLNLVEIATTKAKFTVELINGTKISNFHTGDSVWINDGDRVADICEDESGNVANNYQNNLDNIKRLLTVTFVAIDLGLTPITISPINLGDINNDSSVLIIPIDLLQVIKDSTQITDNWNLVINGNGDPIGMIIQIIPDFGDKDTNSFEKMILEGKISIFDAVGNLIVDRDPMLFINNLTNPNLKKYYKTLNYAWSGKNTLGRFVGSGSYLAVADIKKWPMGKGRAKGYESLSRRIMIAVQD